MNERKIIRHELRRLLLEGSGDTYDYGCVMVFLKITDKDWGKIQNEIDEDDLYVEDGDLSYGREDEPHVTLLYGLHKTVKDEEIEELVSTFDVPSIKLKKISAFENEKYDVLKFDIIGKTKDKLGEFNKKLTEFPHTTSFPDYHPHCTIAYLKSGKAKKYTKDLSNDDEIEINPSKIVYSKADGTKKNYQIKNEK